MAAITANTPSAKSVSVIPTMPAFLRARLFGLRPARLGSSRRTEQASPRIGRYGAFIVVALFAATFTSAAAAKPIVWTKTQAVHQVEKHLTGTATCVVEGLPTRYEDENEYAAFICTDILSNGTAYVLTLEPRTAVTYTVSARSVVAGVAPPVTTPAVTTTPAPAYTAPVTTTPAAPEPITAICVDGSDSYSQTASGTCSHHGGVSVWVNHP